jgi:hypothetical protein
MLAVAGLGRAGNQRDFGMNGFMEDLRSKSRCWTRPCWFLVFASTPQGWATLSRSLRALGLCVRLWVFRLEALSSICCFFCLRNLANKPCYILLWSFSFDISGGL